jgi:hypothetical protein
MGPAQDAHGASARVDASLGGSNMLQRTYEGLVWFDAPWSLLVRRRHWWCTRAARGRWRRRRAAAAGAPSRPPSRCGRPRAGRRGARPGGRRAARARAAGRAGGDGGGAAARDRRAGRLAAPGLSRLFGQGAPAARLRVLCALCAQAPTLPPARRRHSTQSGCCRRWARAAPSPRPQRRCCRRWQSCSWRTTCRAPPPACTQCLGCAACGSAVAAAAAQLRRGPCVHARARAGALGRA